MVTTEDIMLRETSRSSKLFSFTFNLFLMVSWVLLMMNLTRQMGADAVSILDENDFHKLNILPNVDNATATIYN
jgi:hypothetical protein